MHDLWYFHHRELRTQIRLNPNLTNDQRGLAHNMLAYLDDPVMCLQQGVQWLLCNSEADRVDAGYIGAGDVFYRPWVEQRRDQKNVLPSVLNQCFQVADPSIQAVLHARGAKVFADTLDDPCISASMGNLLANAGTRSKLAIALRHQDQSLGLLCMDHRQPHGWSAQSLLQMQFVCNHVIVPVMSAAHALQASQKTTADVVGTASTAVMAPSPSSRPAYLTAAEWEIAHWVVKGLNYKEIAREVQRSHSTVDHHLRSLRRKLGVNSTARLIHKLSVWISSTG